jgi:esterase/lipase superfamily enzyme
MRKLALTIVLAVLAGCRGGIDAEPSAEVTIVPILFGTNRTATGVSSPDEQFGGDLGPLSLGAAEVSIPLNHRLGTIEGPSLLNLEISAQPERHVVLQRVAPLDERDFLAQLQERIRRSDEKSLFVFVHGYNVDFAEAARRTAQMASDLVWGGVALMYSWPSRGSTDDYWSDEKSALESAADLESFLGLIAAYAGAADIHVIAHSMGSLPALTALARHAESTGTAGVPLIDELILAAPDIDAAAFPDLARRVLPATRRVTLYISATDDALALSSLLHQSSRAGDAGAGILIVPGVDTIDASAVDSDVVGHSYYGENRQVLADIFNLLRTHQTPDDRFGLRPALHQGRKYWIMQP